VIARDLEIGWSAFLSPTKLFLKSRAKRGITMTASGFGATTINL